MVQKTVKIIGLSVIQQFGVLKATELKFDAKNKLYPIKGEVGAGKTTLNKAMRLTTQGSDTLVDKNLYGGDVEMVTQLLDGDKSIFVGCKKKEDDTGLTYFIYELDENGKKVQNPVIDGVKATPAAYLKELQTALTWRLNELTSENPTTQRRLLLELYRKELEKKGVVFEKSSPNYVGGIIDKIEKAKDERSYFDMKRKEKGGIADDLKKKGVDYDNRLKPVSTKEIEDEILEETIKRKSALDNPKTEKEQKLLKLKNFGLEYSAKIKAKNDEIKAENQKLKNTETAYYNAIKVYNKNIDDAYNLLTPLVSENQLKAFQSSWQQFLDDSIEEVKKPELNFLKELEFNDKGTCISKADDFKDEEIQNLLKNYLDVGLEYSRISKAEETEVDTKVYDDKIEELQKKLKAKKSYNQDVESVNSLHDWREQNDKVNDLNREFFSLLEGIDTGVSGLHIAPEYDLDDNGNRIARGNDIYLMYDGSYDPEYFHNEDKELRKLSAYSDTQKPMICLLIQNYLLSKKPKILPYLWIDQVPIDNKTKLLLDKMSEELGLWLFVNWTGDFDKDSLKDGEILIENGEIFQPE